MGRQWGFQLRATHEKRRRFFRDGAPNNDKLLVERREAAEQRVVGGVDDAALLHRDVRAVDLVFAFAGEEEVELLVVLVDVVEAALRPGREDLEREVRAAGLDGGDGARVEDADLDVDRAARAVEEVAPLLPVAIQVEVAPGRVRLAAGVTSRWRAGRNSRTVRTTCRCRR